MIKINKYVLFILFVCSLFFTGVYFDKFLSLDFDLFTPKELFRESTGLIGSLGTSIVFYIAVKKRRKEIFDKWYE